mmetsp:Transcript_13964/g.19392  ORF Transcript_13964/g.19392 Transcript_13964/m.19392 type:complete len:271 (+) Transcript_13964:125-937(+)|eukprot:CAMPEP_0185260840 /NCGR_PEP_ID=MMETSP1359-20130426/9381_1 /TAXON_ID=552665 /ORGANISM="Bigelowiella longifila, Strain CCMP242" /LENGTH=270 /DNA_ID=CAMNT_0027847273 /DNA_START=33 /DNA_END=845 /DNA_ORIENTATION=+
MATRIKSLLKANKVAKVFNCGQFLSHKMVEILGLHGGYDGVFIDQEHIPTILQRDIEIAAVTAKSCGMDTFVRRPAIDYASAMAPLEAGAGGVLFSMIRDATHAEEAMEWVKFAPRGRRGLLGANRDGNYFLKSTKQYVKEANESTLIGMQIETEGALNDIEKIAAIEDLDFVLFGPADMSQVLGVTGEVNHEKVWGAISSVSKACAEAGMAWGTVPPNDEYASRAAGLGCQLFLAGHDFAVIHRGIIETKNCYPSLFGEESELKREGAY